MSGRSRQSTSGSGQGRGQGGRSNRRWNNNKKKQKQKKSPPPKIEFAPHKDGKAQVGYKTVLDTIVQHVQKSYKDGKDVTDSLENEKLVDITVHKPDREISQETDVTAQKLEQDGFDIDYQLEYGQYLDRKKNLETNMHRVYALIVKDYCSKAMQHRVEEHPDYESKIKNDPIELLKAIKILMHDPVRARYPFASLTDAFSQMYGVRQKENEGLLKYVETFKQQRDVLKSHVGTHIFDEFVEHLEEYRNETDTSKQQELKDGAFK